MDLPDKEMIHTLEEVKQDGERFHHVNQNGTQFKTYESFVSGIFHLIYLNHS